jgi:hypothetical protein
LYATENNDDDNNITNNNNDENEKDTIDDDNTHNNISILPNVPLGKEFMFLLRKRQPFLKVFLHYQKKHGLKKERLELRFHDKLLSEEDTPYSVQMEQNDTVFVRTCRKPDIVFKVKVRSFVL